MILYSVSGIYGVTGRLSGTIFGILLLLNAMMRPSCPKCPIFESPRRDLDFNPHTWVAYLMPLVFTPYGIWKSKKLGGNVLFAGICSCRICKRSELKPSCQKEFYRHKRKIQKVQLLHYLVLVLLPVLEQINEEQRNELEKPLVRYATRLGSLLKDTLGAALEAKYKKLFEASYTKVKRISKITSCGRRL